MDNLRRRSMKRNLRESNNNFKKAYENYFNLDWLDTYYAKDNDCEKLFARFIKEFEIYLEDDINDIDTSNFEDYLLDFLDDTDDKTFNKLYGLFLNYLVQEDEYMVSQDYCDELYRVDSGAMEESLYLNKSVVEEVIDENWDNEDGFLGFEHKKDLKEAVIKAAEDYGVYDKETYDAGSYGYLDYEMNEDDDMFMIGYEFLGNSEEEYQLETDPFISSKSKLAEYKYNGIDSIDNTVCLRDDCLYGTSQLMYTYGVKVDDIIEAGKELGYL